MGMHMKWWVDVAGHSVLHQLQFIFVDSKTGITILYMALDNIAKWRTAMHCLCVLCCKWLAYKFYSVSKALLSYDIRN